VVAALLTWLFLVSVLLSGLVPGLASADDQIPIQWQAVCHGDPGPISAPQESGDAPVESLPCCVMCCGATHEGAWAPPLAAGLAARAPLCAVRLRPDLQPLAPPSHQARPPQARGPPALI
jgi:hypothetical protein